MLSDYLKILSLQIQFMLDYWWLYFLMVLFALYCMTRK